MSKFHYFQFMSISVLQYDAPLYQEICAIKIKVLVCFMTILCALLVLLVAILVTTITSLYDLTI